MDDDDDLCCKKASFKDDLDALSLIISQISKNVLVSNLSKIQHPLIYDLDFFKSLSSNLQVDLIGTGQLAAV
jgi:hypothetical protein